MTAHDRALEAIALRSKLGDWEGEDAPKPEEFEDNFDEEACEYLSHAGTHYATVSAALLASEAREKRLREALGKIAHEGCSQGWTDNRVCAQIEGLDADDVCHECNARTTLGLPPRTRGDRITAALDEAMREGSAAPRSEP